ncbi:MAG: hypothetical protein GXP49_00500 [Deltaproteobacteria bacterium]|nr:hypothetical protein [Deltaproteobacteria bacterium]
MKKHSPESLLKVPKGFFNRFNEGMGLLGSGVKIAYTGPRLAFSLPPLMINVLIFILAVWMVVEKGGSFIDMVMGPDEGNYLGWLNWLLSGLLKVVLLYLVVTVFPILASIVSAPFLEFLTESQEKYLGTRKDLPAFSFKAMFKDLVTTVSHALKSLLLFIVLSMISVLLEFIPGIGQVIHVVVAVCLSGLLLAFQFMDYAAARRRLSFREKLGILVKDLAGSLGFGIAVFFTFLIPLTAPFVLAPAACGGTLLFLRTGYKNSTTN